MGDGDTAGSLTRPVSPLSLTTHPILSPTAVIFLTRSPPSAPVPTSPHPSPAAPRCPPATALSPTLSPCLCLPLCPLWSPPQDRCPPVTPAVTQGPARAPCPASVPWVACPHPYSTAQGGRRCPHCPPTHPCPPLTCKEGDEDPQPPHPCSGPAQPRSEGPRPQGVPVPALSLSPQRCCPQSPPALCHPGQLPATLRLPVLQGR